MRADPATCPVRVASADDLVDALRRLNLPDPVWVSIAGDVARAVRGNGYTPAPTLMGTLEYWLRRYSAPSALLAVVDPDPLRCACGLVEADDECVPACTAVAPV